MPIIHQMSVGFRPMRIAFGRIVSNRTNGLATFDFEFKNAPAPVSP